MVREYHSHISEDQSHLRAVDKVHLLPSEKSQEEKGKGDRNGAEWLESRGVTEQGEGTNE